MSLGGWWALVAAAMGRRCAAELVLPRVLVGGHFVTVIGTMRGFDSL